MKILDPGHKYELSSLDGDLSQTIQFVKRHDPVNPNRFPGNTNSYPGVTVQMVLRVLLDRTQYLQNQIWCVENYFIMKFIRAILWLFEFRAARRHGKFYFHSLKFASESKMCVKCGHTLCEHETPSNNLL